MKERPILFSGAMVRAILDGRKTQTRRVITKWSGPKLPPGNGANQDGYCTVEDHTIAQKPWTADLIGRLIACPYGQPGDRLWVRETFGIGGGRTTHYYVYRAGDNDIAAHNDHPNDGWKPSIHMPRCASRILLEITDVRVQRLQDINEQDAEKEGAEPIGGLNRGPFRTGFYVLWDHINEARGYGWDKNPWVWVIEFRRITP